MSAITTKNEFLVDQFLLEVGEGRMPAEGSPERVAYQEWRLKQVAESMRIRAEQLRVTLAELRSRNTELKAR